MLSADYLAATALIELRLSQVPARVGAAKPRRSFSQAPELGPGHRLVRRLALLLVSSGGRLVQAGLPPRRPAVVEMSV
jgi:hypothetical protein